MTGKAMFFSNRLINLVKACFPDSGSRLQYQVRDAKDDVDVR